MPAAEADAACSAKFTFAEMLADVPAGSSPCFSVSDAFVAERTIAVSFHVDARFQIRVFKLDDASLTLNRERTIESIQGEVTCLALSTAYGLLAGLWHDGQPWLARWSLNDGAEHETMRLREVLAFAPEMEAICSIVSFPGVTVLGMRSGEVVSFTDCTSSGDFSRSTPQFTKFGASKVSITPAATHDHQEPAVLISCEGNLILWSPSRPGSRFAEVPERKQQIWAVEPATFQGSKVNVDFAAAIELGRHSLSASTTMQTSPENAANDCISSTSSILMLSCNRIIIARLQHQERMVPRHIPLNGTPTRIIYSQPLGCFIVGVIRQNRSTLLFIDPDSGEELARPTDKDGNTLDFVSGLGKDGDRIFGLADWKYKKDKNTWYFVLVTTKAGRLLVLSVESMDATAPADGRRMFRYWTRFKKPLDRPVYSVLATGEELVYCVGSTLHFDIMDTVQRKLKSVHSVDLGSPANSLQRVNGKILALTVKNSLEIIEPPQMGDTTIVEPGGLRHSDTRSRKTIDMVDIAVAQPDHSPSSIVLVATQECQVAGLWVPWQVAKQDCKTLLLAQQLPASIRRFCRARIRPAWSRSGREPQYGRLVSTPDDGELLGACLDGSMQHLTLLSLEGWRFLRFVQNLAQRDEGICPFTYDSETGGASHLDSGVPFNPEPVERPTEMHVNGDILRRCLDRRKLEPLVASGPYEPRFMQLLDELDAGAKVPSQDSNSKAEAYYRMGYGVLRYFLASPF